MINEISNGTKGKETEGIIKEWIEGVGGGIDRDGI